MGSSSGRQTDGGASERHAAWNELFFDLVVVAGVGRLAHLLHTGPTLADLGLYGVLYLAFWISWACFTVYGNIAAEQTHTRNLLLAMLGMAVMAASVSGVRDQRAVSFVLAYVALRWFAGRIWKHTEVVTDWPLAQLGVGSLPWLISVFTPEPWRYWLWALGIAIDLTILITVSSRATLRRANKKLDRIVEHRGLPPSDDPAMRSIQEAHTESAHLAERLGLYLIIVLGEGVIQIIDAAAEHDQWDLPLTATALGAFALLAAIWTLSLLYGYDGVPQLHAHALNPRHALLLHAALTATLAVLAAALGIAVAHADGSLPTRTRWLLCGAMTLYFLIGLAAALTRRPGRTWLLGWALPCVLVPAALLTPIGRDLPTPFLVWVLVVTVGWQILYNSGPPGSAPKGDRPRRADVTGPTT